jgi:Tol biopolymer transport system component
MKTLLLACLSLVLLSNCQHTSEQNQLPSIDFSIADSVRLFAEGIISTQYNVRDFALSPDGDELFYTAQDRRTGFSIILTSRKESNQWTQPEVASFSGNYPDLEPAFSPDGKRLYFASNRPKKDGDEAADADIWFVDKENGLWGEPINPGYPINTDKNEFYPSVTRDGSIYFTATRENGVGREDIFASRMVDGQFQEAVALDTTINSKLDEFNAFVSPDEDYIIFTSWGRKDDTGRGDMYISFKDSEGNWMPAKNLGAKINTKHTEYCPFVSFDQKYFFFTSDRYDGERFNKKALNKDTFEQLSDIPLNGSTNIYLMNFSEVLEMREF